MKLEILSFQEALNYVPKEKSGAIRILNSSRRMKLPSLKKNSNWITIEEYYFDDLWPVDWKEYFWAKDDDWNKLLEIKRRDSPKKITKKSLIDYYESRGHPYEGCILFDEKNARDILKNYEKIESKIKNLVIHCSQGKNRAPAIGIAMNEIYGWGIKGLKEKFPGYRKYIYGVMINVGKKY